MTPVVQCIECTRADIRGARDMAKYGFAVCALKDAWHFEGLTRKQECEQFERADDARVKQRREWLEGQGRENARHVRR